MENIYDKLSEERKVGQQQGKYPDWFTTGAYQMFKDSYEYEADGFKDQIHRVSKTLSRYAAPFPDKDHPYYDRIVESYGSNWEECFFNVMWKGDLSPSTPVLANTGTNRGCSVSCSGQYVGDSVEELYDSRKESALLTKEGFGTSCYLGDWRPRGSSISGGGKAEGSMLALRGFQNDAKDITQGGVRRGAVACYLDMDHDDFHEWCDNLKKNPQHQNIGWNISKDMIRRFEEGDEEANLRRAKTLQTKMITGKGYWWKIDHVNEQQPECYKKHSLVNRASNLCSEIVLFADRYHTYTCVLSSMNCLNYESWKDTGAVFVATIFLDALAEEFIDYAKDKPGLEKAVRYTRKAKSLGLGLLGWHSYLQSNMLAFESFEAHMKNTEIASHMKEESLLASQYIAQTVGEPEWCKGFGIAHTHRMAFAPNISSATLAGQVSQGIEPWLANAFLQPTAAGELTRVNPQFLSFAKSKGKYSKSLIKRVIDNKGSVQDEDWMSEEEKMVFRTAFEIDQSAILRLASTRQRYIDQGQSLNLFFDADEDPEYIAEIHKQFLLDPYLKGLYYVRSESGVQAAKEECVACAS